MRTLPEKYLSEIPVSEDVYKVDLAILDRYQSFSAELLRVALLGLAGYGFLLSTVVLKVVDSRGNFVFLTAFRDARAILAFGALALGVCAACALGHRYYSTDCLTHHVRKLRLRQQHSRATRSDRLEVQSLADDLFGARPQPVAGDENAKAKTADDIILDEADSLKRDLRKCKWLILTAAGALVLGAISVAAAFALVLFGRK